MAASLNRELEMTYSTGFRRRVIARVQSGDSKSAAYRLFGISRSTLHSWLNRADLSPSQGGFRHRKLDRRDFERHVAEHPDALQRERAAHFRVSTSSIRHALKWTTRPSTKPRKLGNSSREAGTNSSSCLPIPQISTPSRNTAQTPKKSRLACRRTLPLTTLFDCTVLNDFYYTCRTPSPLLSPSP